MGRERVVLWDLGGQTGLRSIWPVPFSMVRQLLSKDLTHFPPMGGHRAEILLGGQWPVVPP